MRKKHIILSLTVILLSIAHLVLSIFYARLYAYFNVLSELLSFVLAVQLFRLVCYALIVISGYLALRDKQKKLLVFYLSLFVSNLLMPFLFSIR